MKNKEYNSQYIIARVRANQRHNREIDQLERLHELNIIKEPLKK